MDSALGLLVALYSLGGIITLGVVARWGVGRLPAWIEEFRPHSLEDWVFAPIIGLVGLAVLTLTLWTVVAAWPLVAVVGWREEQRVRAIRRAASEAEDRDLLEEVRRWEEPIRGAGPGH